jgi:stage V sporulation protein G
MKIISIIKNTIKTKNKEGKKVFLTNNISVHSIKQKTMYKFLKLWKAVHKMQITDVRLRKVNSENRMKAVASVTFDNEFVVHDIKVIESQDGLFIAMPSRKTPNGDFKDIAHPINPETREKIQKAILEAYDAPEAEANSAE